MNLQKLYSKNVKLSGKSIYENDGNYDLSKKYILNLVDLIEKNKINTTINNIYNLQEIPKVHQIIENGVYCGKSIIKIY